MSGHAVLVTGKNSDFFSYDNLLLLLYGAVWKYCDIILISFVSMLISLGWLKDLM